MIEIEDARTMPHVLHTVVFFLIQFHNCKYLRPRRLSKPTAGTWT